MGRLVEMVVESVRVHMLSNRHVVILKDAERERYLPIWIGPWEASSIAMKLQGLAAERPLTHDLFAAALEASGSGSIGSSSPSSPTRPTTPACTSSAAARSSSSTPGPSDCVALAVRTATRILVADEVLEQAALGADPDARRTRRPAEPARPRRRPATVERDYRREVPIESLGEAVVDERLEMFRDFINSLDKDSGAGRRAAAAG